MTTFTLKLPDGVGKFVEAAATAEGFAGPNEYVQNLILRAYREKAKRDLEATLLRRLDDMERGEVVKMTDEDWAEIHAEVEQQFQAVCAHAVKNREDVEAKLIVGLEQLERGESTEMTAEDWTEIHAEVERSFQERKTG